MKPFKTCRVKKIVCISRFLFSYFYALYFKVLYSAALVIIIPEAFCYVWSPKELKSRFNFSRSTVIWCLSVRKMTWTFLLFCFYGPFSVSVLHYLLFKKKSDRWKTNHRNLIIVNSCEIWGARRHEFLCTSDVMIFIRRLQPNVA